MLRHFVRAWLAVIALQLAAFGPALQAQASKAGTRLDAAEIEAWADKYYGQAIADKRQDAVILSVVQDGKILFVKGYGYQDAAKKSPLDVNKSRFFVGSITKTFVATAIAQLVDRGVIKSLDDPVNTYLKRVKLPGAWGAKVKISDVLNHRAGFEDIDFGFLTNNSANYPIPLSASEIARFTPKIVQRPGGRANYSNYGFSLLGFMIEDIVNERLDTYLKRNIFDPLGMDHTVFLYDKRPSDIVDYYKFTKTGKPVFQPINMPHPWIAPAGTVISTGPDMARYMNAHILEGRDGGYPLISPRMFKALHTESYRNAPISIGFGHAFWTGKIDGVPSIEHGGGTPGFQSMLTMIPERKIGFFISSATGGLADGEEYTDAEMQGNIAVKESMTGQEFRESFLTRFFPEPAPYTGGAKSDLRNLVGTYLTQKRPYTTVEKLGAAFNPAAQLDISLAPDGKAILMNGFGPYTDVGNGIFKNASGESKWLDPYIIDNFKPDYIAFNLTDDGKVIDFVAGMGDQVWEPASPIFNPQIMLLVFMVAGSILLSGAALFAWPAKPRLRNAANWVGVGIALCMGAIVYSVIGGFAVDDSLPNQMALGHAGRLWSMAIACNLSLLLGVILALLSWAEYRQPKTGRKGWGILSRRIHQVILIMAVAALIPAFAQYNLIGFHIPG